MGNKAIFLDRDGVVCVNTHFITSLDKLIIFDYSKKAISIFREMGFLSILVTNQSAVARGYMSEDEVRFINDKIKEEIKYDDVFFCPHLPQEKNPYLQNKFIQNCNCRKPKTGMIDEAVKKYNIDRSESYMVGDSLTDIMAGKSAGLKTVFVGKKDCGEIEKIIDYKFDTLIEFAEFIGGIER